ncbi:MAG: hypothetical protein M1821_005959 [Bathelium mastoideum]|nr:MAG: hypothetical protein M1821_005959 [Bathelium mastoideum]KAI9688503.1 MAG: hypothetical protein M1822_001452 [Bathelium mastoideum]
MTSDQEPLLPHSSTTPSNHIASTLAKRNNQARHHLRRYLSSKLGHYIVLALVTVDVASIFADLVIQTFQCERPSRGAGGGEDAKLADALEALGLVSLVISCLFLVELAASVWAFGFSYFRSKFHCFDAVVILVAFVIDVLLHGVVEEIASLVVILRLWRVFKIVEELSGAAEEQMDALRERIAELEEENGDLKIRLQHATPVA